MEVTELYRKIKLIYEYILEIRAILSNPSLLYIQTIFTWHFKPGGKAKYFTTSYGLYAHRHSLWIIGRRSNYFCSPFASHYMNHNLSSY